MKNWTVTYKRKTGQGVSQKLLKGFKGENALEVRTNFEKFRNGRQSIVMMEMKLIPSKVKA